MISKKNYKQAILYLIITLFVTAAGAFENNKPNTLVRISIEDRASLDMITAMGVDVWHLETDHVTASVDQSQLEEITAKGLAVDVLIDDLDEYSRNALYTRVLTASSDPNSIRYKTNPEIVMALTALGESDIAEIYDIGDSVEGRDIWAVKISDNPQLQEDEPEILLVGTHHAREWIAAEVPLYIAQQLVRQYDTDPDIRKLIDSRQIWIIPVVNPDGFVYSWDTDRWWRKNRKYNGSFDGRGDVYGVDLNRNYDHFWGLNDTGSSPNPWTQTYRGPAAFSEPETQAVRDIIDAHDFQVLVTYHNYSQLILYPWGYNSNPAPGKPLLSNMAERMSQLIESVHGVSYTPQQGYELYPTNGTTDDWSYGQHSIPSFTIELRPKGSPYFELPEDEILPTCQENFPAALYLIAWHRADLNGDGHVNLNDFSIFASQWLNQECVAQGWCDGVDTNKNTSVEVDDFIPFVKHWGEENIYSKVKSPLIWIPSQSHNWDYRPGISEPHPDWRDVDFVQDETWLSGRTSVGYGDDDDNTFLSDMRYNYGTVYLRHSFNIESEEDIPDRLFLKLYVDDGCIVTLNNKQEWRFHVSTGDKQFDSTTGSTNHEAAWETFEIPNPSELLNVGKNVLAIHALNVNLESSDFSIDAELITY